MTSINYIFCALDEFVLCKGFPVVSQITTKNSEGNTTRTTEDWKTAVDVSNSPKLFLRSVSCSVLRQPGYTRVASELCDHCFLLKQNSVIFSKEREFVKKKQESYMSDEDLKEKIWREQKRRRNAERRAKYQENRINSEMKAFEDEDHHDFMYMIKRVKKGSLNDDMKILFELQEKALAQKNSKRK